MNVNELLENVDTLLDQLKIFDLDDELVEVVRKGTVTQAEEEEILRLGDKLIDQLDSYRTFISILQKIRDAPEEEEFWDRLHVRSVSPAVFQLPCLALLENNSECQRVGGLLYSILLGMKPISLVWNEKIFNRLLSIMVLATQALEGDEILSEESVDALHVTPDLLEELSHAMTQTFQELAGRDIVIALIELSVKICCAQRKSIEKFGREAVPKVWNFLKVISNLSMDYALPAIVLALLLDFLPASRQVTAPVIQIREDFMTFCKDNLSEEQLALVIKHLVIRAPERQALRESVAHVVYEFLKTCSNSGTLYGFLLKVINTQRSLLRMMGLEVFKKMLEDPEWPSEEADLLSNFASRILLRLRDTSPGVRSVAVACTAALIYRSATSTEAGAWLFRFKSELESLLIKRVTDEKLAVRKATLKWIRAIIEIESNPPKKDLLLLIAERTRDRSLLIRQDAINLLSDCLTKFDTDEIRKLWFDNILPRAMDVDSKTQELALKQIEKCLFMEVERAESMEREHMGLMVKVIDVYKQKAMNLGGFVRKLEKKLGYDSPPVFWELESALLSVAPVHSKINFLEFWDDRDHFPPEYLACLSKLGRKNDTVLSDAMVFLEELGNGALQDESFARVHWMVAIVAAMNDDKDFADDLVVRLSSRINEAVENQMLAQQDMLNLISSMFLLGELMEYCSNLRDLDFTGLQIMISEALPNQVTIPESVRAAATIAVGKLCLWRRDMSSSFVAAFASQLHQAGIAAVKCNCLVTLCDLCVKYSATVDPYVVDMTACFRDNDPCVRCQALLIITKLITEDYLKIKQLIFFRFVVTLVDPDPNVAKFAQSCLFDVINAKDPRLITENFIGSLLYFNGFLDLEGEETAEEHKLFEITDAEKRGRAYRLMVSHMSRLVLFRLLQGICTLILQDFVDGAKDIEDGEPLLRDTIDVMIAIENEMEEVSSLESATDDPQTEKFVRDSKIYISEIHDKLIHSILPVLNQTHRYLRANNSPLQSDLRVFFRGLCEKHPTLIEELKRQEPILAEELQHDMAKGATPVLDSPPPSPSRLSPFRSPLLTRIARSSAVSGNASPIPLVIMRPQDVDEAVGKQPPVPLNLD